MPQTFNSSVKLQAVDWSILFNFGLDPFGQRVQYISIKFPLHKQSENLWVCY